MNFFIQLTCLFFLFATTLSAQDNGNQVALEVQIDELVSSKGWIAIQLLNSNKRKVASAHEMEMGKWKQILWDSQQKDMVFLIMLLVF